MKTINITDDILEFHKFFGDIESKNESILVWQVNPSTYKRVIFYSHLSSFEVEDNTLSFSTISDEAYVFDSEEIYFYIENFKLIFKAEQISIQNNFLTVHYPDELKMLDKNEDNNLKKVFMGINPAFIQNPPKAEGVTLETDQGSENELVKGAGRANTMSSDFERVNGTNEIIDTVWKGSTGGQSDHDKEFFEKELSYVTLDEEDKKYEGQRDAPRAKPPEGKFIIVQTKDLSRPQETLPLYDLSRGGMGFMVFSSEAYSQGETLNVYGFDSKKFDNPMLAIVRSVREADEKGIQFKVGCEFIKDENADEHFAKYSGEHRSD